MIRAAVSMAITLPLLLTVLDEFWSWADSLVSVLPAPPPFFVSPLGMTTMSSAQCLLTRELDVLSPLAGLLVEHPGAHGCPLPVFLSLHHLTDAPKIANKTTTFEWMKHPRY